MNTIHQKPKVAVVIQRYGKNVLGGESLCRHVMKRLQRTLNITILTTCACDHRHWDNAFDPGWQRDEDITVLRFPVRQRRRMFRFKWATQFTYLCQWLYRHKLCWRRLFNTVQHNWLKNQGPYCPELLQFLQENHHRYDAFIFFTYLYYPTACGIELVKDKAILFPSAHDERPIYLPWYQHVFTAPAALIMQTPEEQQLVNRLFPIKHKPQRLAAMHVSTINELSDRQADVLAKAVIQFIQKYNLESPYILYTGRIETAKGSAWMFKHFTRFINDTRQNVQLVLLGQAYVKIPKHPNIRYLGFLTDIEKRCAMLGCQFFLMPSFFESFSVSLLEALGMARPAIVNGQCPVLRGHIRRSQAGFAVNTYEEFKQACLTLLHQDANAYGQRGLQYVQQHYTWEKVAQAYLELIEWILRQSTKTNPLASNLEPILALKSQSA